MLCFLKIRNNLKLGLEDVRNFYEKCTFTNLQNEMAGSLFWTSNTYFSSLSRRPSQKPMKTLAFSSSQMRDFRQKEKKKKLPQNKPSRDESSLPRCNISSMAGSSAHGCFVNFHYLRRKNNKKKHVQHNHGEKVRIALLMNCVNAAMFLGSAEPTMDEGLQRCRQGSSRLGLFWGKFFFSFWRKSLIEGLAMSFPMKEGLSWNWDRICMRFTFIPIRYGASVDSKFE